MLREVDVLYKLAAKGEVNRRGVRICKVVWRGRFMHASEVPMWVVQTQEMTYEYAVEDIEQAVAKFLEVLPPPVDLSIIPDADVLKKQAINAANYQYKQWCARNYDDIATIATSIRIAEAAGNRTIWFDVPRSDAENYRRFFTERHYVVKVQSYNNKQDSLRVTLD